MIRVVSFLESFDFYTYFRDPDKYVNALAASIVGLMSWIYVALVALCSLGPI